VELGLIPPPKELNLDLPETGFHLLLPHLFQQEAYQKYCHSCEGWKVLDNGEAEGILRPEIYRLHSLYTEYEFDEVVIPDTIGNLEETLVQLAKFEFWAHLFHKRMGVVQGANWEEVIICMDVMRTCPYVDTIAIPRHLCKTLNDKYARVKIVTMLNHPASETDKPIHALGSSAWAEEVKAFSVRNVRSMDTSLPFNYAFEGVRLSTLEHIPVGHSTPEVPQRAGEYETRTYEDDTERGLAEDNARTFYAWARGSETPSTRHLRGV
jgi:hypothetical protein